MSYTLTKEDVMVLAKKEHIKYEDACKEIETHIKLNKQLLEDIDKAGKEIERLNNMINKAIKKLNKYRNRKDTWGLWCMEYGDNAEIIKILGGEVKNE